MDFGIIVMCIITVIFAVVLHAISRLTPDWEKKPGDALKFVSAILLVFFMLVSTAVLAFLVPETVEDSVGTAAPGETIISIV